MLALPGVTPLAAMALATPVAGATTVAIVIAVAELYWRGRSTGRPELLRWGPETLTDEPSTTITETLGLGEFQTQIDRTLTLTDRKGVQRDLSDDEIERAIAEIQATIQRYRK